MRYYLLLGLLIIGLLPQSLLAQQLDATDTAEIQQKALRHVRQLEGLLNVISQSDEYFRKYDFDQLIRDYYTDQSNYQIFRDSLVVVEDDLNPKDETRDYENLLTIKNYLKAFFSLYAKSPPPSVIFDNYEVSDVRKNEFTYVEVFYDSKFRNRHRAFPDLTYPLRRRKATVKAEPQAGGWRVVITDLSYAQPNEPVAVAPADEVAPATAAPVAVTEQEVPDDTATAPPMSTLAEESTILPEISEAETEPEPEVADLPIDNTFENTRSIYRKDKTYQLPLRANPTSPPTSLMLYQGAELVEDLSRTLADSSFTWQVPQEIAEGDNYQFRFYDPVTEAVVESTPFEIKRKARWPLVAGAAGVAAVVYLVVSSSGDGGGDGGSDELPAPPSPK